MTGKVYKIVNSVDNKLYIGSTFQNLLCRRMGQHRTAARHRMDKTSPLYTHMRTLGVEKFMIVLLRTVDTDDINVLQAVEFRQINKRDPDRLLNLNLEHGKHSAEHNRKVGDAQRGSKSHAFRRGSIMRLQRMSGGYPSDIIAFRWIVDGKQRSKSWSIKIFGLEEAMRLAEAMRDEIYPEEE